MALRFFFCFLVSLMLGCAGHHVHISDDDFILVKTDASDSYESLAKEYLGNPYFAGVIKKVNPNISNAANSFIAIPKKPLRRYGISVDGYQTVPVLCYHQFVGDAKSQHAMEVSVDAFKQQMEYLRKNGYHVVSLNDFGLFLNGELALPDKSVVITVDDGFKSFYEFAYPVLKDYNFPATLFVYPDFVGGRLALDWTQIKKLDADPLIDIQSHSYAHSNLSKLEQGEDLTKYKKRLDLEITDSDKVLQSQLNKRLSHFAYPFGDTNTDVINRLRAQNYKIGVTVNRGQTLVLLSHFLLIEA